MDMLFSTAFDHDYDKKFASLANQLINQYILKVNNTEYRFTELEFYYYEPEKHEDQYVHKNDQQLSSGKWYHHGSGLDITFGNKSKGAFGGILIRGIKDLNNGKYIDGSLNVVTEVFSHFTDVNEIYNKFGLVEKSLPLEKPIRAQRIGLNEETDPEFYPKPYRFIIEINPNHQFKEKTRVAQQMKEDGYSSEDINKMFGYEIIK